MKFGLARLSARVLSSEPCAGAIIYPRIFLPHRRFATDSGVGNTIRQAFDEYMKFRTFESADPNSPIPSKKAQPNAHDHIMSISTGDLSNSFASFGLDGLDEVELVLTIESKLGITLSDEDFHAIHSVADAIRIISKLEKIQIRDA
jgi:acyl carrier protein